MKIKIESDLPRQFERVSKTLSLSSQGKLQWNTERWSCGSDTAYYTILSRNDHKFPRDPF